MPAATPRPDELKMLAGLARACAYDPLRWAKAAFPWGKADTPLHDQALRTWQADILATIRDHLSDPDTRHTPLRIAIASGHGIGKAQPVDMIVDTPSGPRRWGDLLGGDRLHGPDGPVRITQVHETRLRQCVRIRLDDGSETVCDSDHLWTVRRIARRGVSPWQVMSAAEIAAQIAAHGHNLGDVAPLVFATPTINTPLVYDAPPRMPSVSPFLLGWWLTAGIADTTRGSGLDMDEAERLCAYDEASEASVAANATAWTVEFDSLRVPLQMAGLLPTPVNRFIPDAWARQAAAWRLDLLRGIVQGQGGGPSAGRPVLRTADARLRADVQALVNGLGGRVRHMPGGRMAILLPDGMDLFAGSPHAGKTAPVDPNEMTRNIVSVAYAGAQPVRCVTVDHPEGLYVTENQIVTHNSAAMAMIGNWGLVCHPRARIVVTANTEGQLRTKTSPEFAKWARMSIAAPLLDVDTMRISVKSERSRENWRLDFSSWSEHNTEAFQGLHNKGSLLAVLVDEGSAIPDNVFDVIEGALTDSDTILLLIVFGNPTRNDGRFREFWRRERARWLTRQIDSRTVEGVNREEIDRWVRERGEDSDYIRVRVRGLFPRASTRQFIPESLVDEAAGRHLRDEQYAFAPVVLSCDPAWTGDDELVIGYRQGLFFDILEAIPNHGAGRAADIFVAQRLAHYEQSYQASAVFIDAGYGTGIKSAGDAMGRNWQLVWFSGKSGDPGCLNKRAEMWLNARNWLEQGGAIPDDPVLRQDLIGPETLPQIDGKIALESKEDMRRRRVPSPNRADALALTFAAPVVKSGLLPYAAADNRAVIPAYVHNPFGD